MDGLVVAPVLGGYCVFGPTADSFPGRLSPPHRLLEGPKDIAIELAAAEPDWRARVLRLLGGPAACRFGSGGAALATDGFARDLRRASRGPLWFGVPEEPAEPGELIDELGSRVSAVVTADDEWLPGPSVFDLRSRPVVVDRIGKLAILDGELILGELVRLGPGVAFTVLVVCTGNSCRSPMAAGLLAKLVRGLPVFVHSSGTAAPVGSPATPAAVEAARRLGADIVAHRARQLDPAQVQRADLVLCMDHHHRERVLNAVPEAVGKARLLLEFADRPDDAVADPVGRPLEVYEQTLDEMTPALVRVAADLRNRLSRQATDPFDSSGRQP